MRMMFRKSKSAHIHVNWRCLCSSCLATKHHQITSPWMNQEQAGKYTAHNFRSCHSRRKKLFHSFAPILHNVSIMFSFLQASYHLTLRYPISPPGVLSHWFWDYGRSHGSSMCFPQIASSSLPFAFLLFPSADKPLPLEETGILRSNFMRMRWTTTKYRITTVHRCSFCSAFCTSL